MMKEPTKCLDTDKQNMLWALKVISEITNSKTNRNLCIMMQIIGDITKCCPGEPDLSEIFDRINKIAKDGLKNV